jgi:hypothetical protein
MVLSGTKKTSGLSSVTNQDQGGGNNKPGLYPQVGRSSWTSVAFGTQNVNAIKYGRCCKRSNLIRTTGMHFTRPIGGATVSVPYFR